MGVMFSNSCQFDKCGGFMEGENRIPVADQVNVLISAINVNPHPNNDNSFSAMPYRLLLDLFGNDSSSVCNSSNFHNDCVAGLHIKLMEYKKENIESGKKKQIG